MIRFGPDVCANLDAALRCEWLETNVLLLQDTSLQRNPQPHQLAF